MINALFFTVVIISLTCAIMIIALMAIKAAAIRAGYPIAARWICICWLMLAVRMLIPVNLPVAMIDISLLQASDNSAVVNTLDGGDYSADFETAAQPTTDTNDHITPKHNSAEIFDMAVVVWLVGIVAFAIWQMYVYYSARRRLLAHAAMPDDSVMKMVESIAASQNVKRKFRVLICNERISPMLMGTISPVLFLPEELGAEDLRLSIIHELAHLKRADLWLKFVITAANAVHWFNPVVWMMVTQVNEDIEMACDDRVLSGLDISGRRDYCDSILNMMSGRQTPFAAAFTYRKENIMNRFKNILNVNKRRSGISAMLFVLCGSILLSGLIGCTSVEDVIQDQVSIEHNMAIDDVKVVSEKDFTPGADAVMDMINFYRAEQGLQKLAIDDEKLAQAASIRSIEIQNAFSRTRPDGSSFRSVYIDIGIEGTNFCEMLGYGQQSAAEIVEAWMSSPDHAKIILDNEITSMRVSVTQNESGVNYWVFSAYTSK